jgi:hypothetical protein
MAGEAFWGHVHKLTVNFEEILLSPPNFEKQKNKDFNSSIIIINYCTIKIISYYYMV